MLPVVEATEGHNRYPSFGCHPADFKPFLEAVEPFYNDIEEMTHYQVRLRPPGAAT
jgi:hypothetical protein